MRPSPGSTRACSPRADLYDVELEQSIHLEPAVILRGTRCLSCERIVADPAKVVDGLGLECR